MMKCFFIVTVVTMLFTGCATTEQQPIGLAKPVQVPALPPELSRKAARLPDIKDDTFGGIIKDGLETDKSYNAIAHQLNAVIDLYECVRKAMNKESAVVEPQKVCVDKK